MGIYIGILDIKSTPHSYDKEFYNFKPIAEVNNDQIRMLSQLDQEKLLPESEKRNIFLWHDWDSEQDQKRMKKLFPKNSLSVFEFSLEDLEPNYYKNTRERNQTGYKVTAKNMIKQGKLKPIGNFGVYYAIQSKDLRSDFYEDATVQISQRNLVEGNKVFVELENIWAGPYEVRFSEIASSYCIKPEIKEHKYTISGYHKEDMNVFPVEYQDGGYYDSPEYDGIILCPKISAERMQIDVISNETLIENFKESVLKCPIENGTLNVDDLKKLLDEYETNELSGDEIPDHISRSRLNKLVNILTSGEEIDETLHLVTDFICDLLVKYQDSENVNEWVKSLIAKNPELLTNLKRTKIISEHINNLNDELDELKIERDQLNVEIQQKRKDIESIDKQAIEEKKQVMLDQEIEYNSLSTKLEELKKEYGLVEKYGSLQDRISELEKNVSYKETREKELDNKIENLENDCNAVVEGIDQTVSNTIKNSHDKMIKSVVDGFFSSTMLRAAAEWDAEQNENLHMRTLEKIHSITVEEKTSEQLIGYMCDIVQSCRPNYNRNLIINIATCIIQGFLTVFSGEPGCGKTSICNIFAETLGLNKISEIIECSESEKSFVNRYVAVSVERGWTSKRDFIGYYNPLSKVFDKSNMQIYAALQQLDIEKKKKISKLPYIVLLDEANLSPMEYYWSDFMNICDDLGPNSKVNMGDEYVFEIPETLRFLATINNDHTTEMLSPRLIDRAWVISLPQLSSSQYYSVTNNRKLSEEKIEILSWDSLKNALMPNEEDCIFTSEVQKCYIQIIDKLQERQFTISPRVDKAIKRYWGTTSRLFEPDETGTEAAIVALDYAVAQRILPKIAGSGEEFETWLNDLRALCSKYNLNMSAKMLKDIIEQGNQEMKYYRFFG